MKKLLPMVGLIVLLLGIAAFAQSPAAPAPTAPLKVSSAPTAPPVSAPIAADSELLLIFQAHRVTSELIEARLKAAGVPELQQELRVLQARFEAWKRAKNVPPGWVWSDERKQFEPPAPITSAPASVSQQPSAGRQASSAAPAPVKKEN